ncbi:hypothetical protein ACJ5W3_003879 [Enterobacter hormaechei]|nr:hypothetical protein [Enterobacter hormaechei subsp. steigerwaltii]ELX8342683.1 hypothetical protein [Enterobacter hormaechei]ELZ2866077.1 hypothetical protein [Enterobacter hormaechei]
MGVDERYELRVKELKNKIYDLKDSLETAKENAFSAHEDYVSTGKADPEKYDEACTKRESLKEELFNAESELNNIISKRYEGEFRKHEREQFQFGMHSKNIINIAFVCLGLAFALLIKRLFF